MFNHKITKEQFDRLFQEDVITVKEYRETCTKITDRIEEVMKFITKKDRGMWWVFSNNTEDNEENFDPQFYYGGNINLNGEFELIDKNEKYMRQEDFPIEWLWEDLPDDLVELCNEYHDENARKMKEEELLKKLEKERRKKEKEIKKSLKLKLTREELEFLKISLKD